MYDWLRKKQREFYVLFCVAEARGTNKLAWDYDTSVQFVNWLEATGATLSVGRVGPLQETPMLVLPDEYYDNVEGE